MLRTAARLTYIHHQALHVHFALHRYLQRYSALRESVRSSKMPHGVVHSVRYDELLSRPEATLQGIADFLGVTPAFDLAEVPTRS